MIMDRATETNTARVVRIREEIARCEPRERFAIALRVLAKFDSEGNWNRGCSHEADEGLEQMTQRYDSEDDGGQSLRPSRPTFA